MQLLTDKSKSENRTSYSFTLGLLMGTVVGAAVGSLCLAPKSSPSSDSLLDNAARLRAHLQELEETFLRSEAHRN